MATQFLANDQSISAIVNPGGAIPAGRLVIAFHGTMDPDEKWKIEAKAVDATDWISVHKIDNDSATGTDIDKWQGPRDKDRIFEIPLADGFEYRVSKVTTGANTTVTAYWAEGMTSLLI